jgi:hypothetical protein
VAAASIGAARTFFAPASAAVTAALVAVADADAAAAESVVVCAGPAAAAVPADEVAAIAADDVAVIAAAAMASGAVALPDPAGALVETMITGTATAIGFGVVMDGPPGCAAALGSAAEVLSEDDFPVDFEVLAFEGSEFEPVCWTVLLLVLVLASDGWLVPELPTDESLLAAWLAAELAGGGVLFEAAGASS